MIDYTALTDEFTGLVGWRQSPSGSGLIALEADLIQSESGLSYNRHAYLTPDSIQAIAPDYVNQISDESERATAFNTWLREITAEGIKQALSNWWTTKMVANTARSLISLRDAFWYDGPVKFDTPPSERRLGLYVRPFANMTDMLHFKVSHIGLALSTPQEVTVYFQPDGTNTPIEVTVDYTGNGEQQWLPIPNPIIMKSSGYRGFFVYVKSDEITGEVITFRGNCNCKMSSRFVSITGHNGPDENSTTEFGMRPYATRENYGINIKLEGYCDYTEFVTGQKHALAPLMSLQVADYMLRTMAANPHGRLNRNEGQADPDRILYQVDGDPQGRITGIAAELKDAYAAASFDREGVDKYCLPCNNDYGISRNPTG